MRHYIASFGALAGVVHAFVVVRLHEVAGVPQARQHTECLRLGGSGFLEHFQSFLCFFCGYEHVAGHGALVMVGLAAHQSLHQRCEILAGHIVAGGLGFFVTVNGFEKVALHTVALHVEHAEVVHGVAVAQAGCACVPSGAFGGVGRGAFAVDVHQAETVHCRCLAVGGGAPEPSQGLAIVGIGAFAAVIELS